MAHRGARPLPPFGEVAGDAHRFAIGVKALLDGKLGREVARERNRAAVLDELARWFGEKEGTAAD
jgi:hypothetical protein